MSNRFLLVTSILVIMLFVGGCNNNKPTVAKNITDNVNQHIVSALELLEKKDTLGAKSSIKRALELNPRSSVALSTKGVIDKNFSLVEKAKRYSNSKVDKYINYISAIRVLDDEKKIDMYYRLANSVDTSNIFIPYYKDKGSLDFFTAKRFFEFTKYNKAKKYFANVFDRKNSYKFSQKAREWWEKTDRIVRVLKLAKWSLNAKKLVAKEKIKRVDATVVLVDDLHLEKLLKGAFRSYNNEKVNLPEDIKNHPNKYELEIVYRYKLRGLNSIVKNGKIVFAPDDSITREEFAMVLEDIVSRYKNDPKYKIRFFGNKSPFVDVKATSASFNAIMNAVSMGFMHANTYGEFHPKRPLSGVELIEAIAKIKEELML